MALFSVSSTFAVKDNVWLMKQHHLFLLGLCSLLFCVTSTQAQTLTINTFEIEADGSDILVTWDLQDESKVVEYRLFRRFNEANTSTHVTTLKPDGTGDYTYLDDDIFKQNARVLHYELQIIVQGQTHTYTRSLIHNPTSIQRTWGSIKSMFRY